MCFYAVVRPLKPCIRASLEYRNRTSGMDRIQAQCMQYLETGRQHRSLCVLLVDNRAILKDLGGSNSHDSLETSDHVKMLVTMVTCLHFNTRTE